MRRPADPRLARRAATLPALRGRLRAIVALAVAEIAVPFSLIAAGERSISSSLAAIVIAAVPLVVAVLAMRFDPDELHAWIERSRAAWRPGDSSTATLRRVS